MCCLIFDCVSLGFECKTERNNIRPFYCMNSQNEKNEKMYIMTLLKQNGTIPSLSAPSIFHSESYNFAHENHNCPFCSPAFFSYFFYQPGHYNVPGRVLSTGFMVKFIVNPVEILCFTEVDVYAAAFALIVSMMFFQKGSN